MTPFSVRWHRTAENHLAELWLEEADRNAVTRAQAAIDRLLSIRPHSGVPLSEGLWTIDIPPLRAYFEIHESDASVRISAVSRLRTEKR